MEFNSYSPKADKSVFSKDLAAKLGVSAHLLLALSIEEVILPSQQAPAAGLCCLTAYEKTTLEEASVVRVCGVVTVQARVSFPVVIGSQLILTLSDSDLGARSGMGAGSSSDLNSRFLGPGLGIGADRLLVVPGRQV